MGAQEDIQMERRLKNKILELKQSIRILFCVVLVLAVSTIALVIVLLYSSLKTDSDIAGDTGRFEGEHRLEQYTMQCTYGEKEDDGALSYVYTTDILEFAGEGYEKVAASIEKYYSEDNLQAMLEGRHSMVTSFPVSETVKLECTRMDDTIISIKRLLRFAEASGFFIQDGQTFSVKTGKLLELDDLLMPKAKKDFYNSIDELIVAQLPIAYPEIVELCPDYKNIYQEEYADKDILPEWHLEETGIAFSFEDLAFLSRGDALPCMMVVVPYDQISDYLKPEYIYQGE